MGDWFVSVDEPPFRVDAAKTRWRELDGVLPNEIEKMEIVVWANTGDKTGRNHVARVAFPGLGEVRGPCLVTGTQTPDGKFGSVPDEIVDRLWTAFEIAQTTFPYPLPECAPKKETLPADATCTRIGLDDEKVLPVLAWEGWRDGWDGSTLKEMKSRGVFCYKGKWYELVDMRKGSYKLSGPLEMTQHPETNAPLRIGWVSALKMIAHFKVAGEAPPYTTLAYYRRACTFEPGKGFMVGIRTPWMLFLSLVYGYESTLNWRWQRELWCSRPLEGNFEAWEADPNNVLPLIPPP